MKVGNRVSLGQLHDQIGTASEAGVSTLAFSILSANTSMSLPRQKSADKKWH